VGVAGAVGRSPGAPLGLRSGASLGFAPGRALGLPPGTSLGLPGVNVGSAATVFWASATIAAMSVIVAVTIASTFACASAVKATATPGEPDGFALSLGFALGEPLGAACAAQQRRAEFRFRL